LQFDCELNWRRGICIILSLRAAMVLRYSIKTSSGVTRTLHLLILLPRSILYPLDVLGDSTCARMCVIAAEFYFDPGVIPILLDIVRFIIASLDR